MNKELYEILEIEITASVEEIKKAYRKQALLHHPDKGGDVEKFKKLNCAHEILSDPEKRKRYDVTGKYTEEPPNHFHGPFEDIMQNFFNMHMPNMPNMSNMQKSAPVIAKFPVSLEDLCQRRVKKVGLSRPRLCSCTQNHKNCTDCDGKGIKLVRIHPMMPIATQQICSTCKGKGKSFTPCGKCSNGNINVMKELDIHLTPEIQHGHHYNFPNEGVEQFNQPAGDLIIEIEHLPHSSFTLQGKNLVYTHNISLKDALCGHFCEITHPSNERISFFAPEIVQPNSKKIIVNKGMTPEGNLEIVYKVNFPETLSPDQIEVIKKIF